MADWGYVAGSLDSVYLPVKAFNAPDGILGRHPFPFLLDGTQIARIIDDEDKCRRKSN